MWKTFAICGNPYMMNITEIGEVVNIYLSNLMELWHCEYTKDGLAKAFYEFNPTMVVDTKEAVSQTLKIISEINEGEVLVTKSNDKLEITIKSYILGFDDTKFKVNYNLLLKKDGAKFSEYITAPMIHTIKYLEKQQKMLCDLLLNKDRELEEYKMEKGNISRADLTTERFDPKVVENTSDKLFLNVYNANNIFWDSFVTRYGNIEDKVVDVAVEPWNHIKKKRKVYNSKKSKISDNSKDIVKKQ